MASSTDNDDDFSWFLEPHSYEKEDALELAAPAAKLQKPETKEEKREREVQEVQTPPKSMTGVTESVTRICAKLSYKIYKATFIEDFEGLSTDGLDVIVLKFTDHGVLAATTPSFCVAVIESIDTMVLVWRGSVTKMDWVVDLAVAPIASSRWTQVAKSLRAHAGYTALVESDLAVHEEWLVEQIEKHGYTQILLTGHSLAGAMAQIAQVAIEGQLSLPKSCTSGSPWSRLRDKSITCRSIQFGAPMTCLLLDDDTQSSAFWEKLSKRSCNIVYGYDMFPRTPGNFRYVNNATRKALVPFIRDAFKGVPLLGIIDLFPGAQQKLIDLYQDQTKKQAVISILKVCRQFQHVGSIVYYRTIGEAPIMLDDYEFRTSSKYQYSIPNEVKYPNRRLAEDHRRFPAILAFDTQSKHVNK